MFKFLKYLPLVSLMQNVSDTYKEGTGKDRPAYLSRRFIGALIVAVGAFLSIQSGMTIDQNILDQIIENTDRLISAGIALYGLIVVIVGVVKRKK